MGFIDFALQLQSAIKFRQKWMQWFESGGRGVRLVEFELQWQGLLDD